jgi:enoyl-CoA hydratase
MALSGRPITADEAHAHGLVTRVTDPGGALEGALVLAEEIAGNAPSALSASCRLLRAAYGRTQEEYWPLQDELRSQVFSSPDAREGAIAFTEKRPPTWTGTSDPGR